jgi:plasmid stabilization system protein ParE
MRAKKRLDWTQTARHQYLDQLAWIAERNPVAAHGVQRRIEHSLDLIQTDPALGTPDKKKRRRHPVPHTPFTRLLSITASNDPAFRFSASCTSARTAEYVPRSRRG